MEALLVFLVADLHLLLVADRGEGELSKALVLPGEPEEAWLVCRVGLVGNSFLGLPDPQV